MKSHKYIQIASSSEWCCSVKSTHAHHRHQLLLWLCPNMLQSNAHWFKMLGDSYRKLQFMRTRLYQIHARHKCVRVNMISWHHFSTETNKNGTYSCLKKQCADAVVKMEKNHEGYNKINKQMQRWHCLHRRKLQVTPTRRQKNFSGDNDDRNIVKVKTCGSMASYSCQIQSTIAMQTNDSQ